MLEMENIAARVENDRHAFLIRRFTSGTQARGRILDAADRAMKAVLQVDPDDTGLNDFGHMRRDFGRCHAISCLNICSHRHLRGPHDTRRRSHHVPPWSMFAIGVPQCPGYAPAGCRQCIEAGSGEESCAQCIPHIRQQENGRGVMPRKKRISHLRLLRSIHIGLAVVAGSVAPEPSTVKALFG
jgi:hypothetical protein